MQLVEDPVYQWQRPNKHPLSISHNTWLRWLEAAEQPEQNEKTQ